MIRQRRQKLGVATADYVVILRSMAPDWKDVGDFIRRRRRAQAWDLIDLAKAAGVSESTVRQLEQGKRSDYHDATLVKVARGLGEPSNALLVLAGRVDAEDLPRGDPGRALHARGFDETLMAPDEETGMLLDEVTRELARLVMGQREGGQNPPQHVIDQLIVVAETTARETVERILNERRAEEQDGARADPTGDD